WLGSQRYRDELRALNERQGSIRDDLSPADYDRYLYALGRPNRVTVNNVLSGSPADQAGLQAGDQILSYDGQRVFNSGEIRRATTSGLAGQSVAVEVERDGQTQVLYLPRGPLGVQMGSTVTPP
ncbi:MAG: PDZ domain-containing protein, partial [Gammaproteobacteria bacterium]|nr:PDZ domain-containing protein [Gammaproteobacteria bacterium]